MKKNNWILLLFYLFTVFVVQAQPQAGFTLPGSNGYCVNANLQFTNTSTNATSYYWDFGDGNTASQTAPSHTYSSGGTYIVTLQVSDGILTSTTRKAIYVRGVPGAYFSISQGFSGVRPGEVIKPLNYSSGAVAYKWDIGGFILNQDRVTWSFSTPGTYQIKLTAYNGCGDSSSYTQGIQVIDTNNYQPMASGSVNPQILCPGALLNMNNYTSLFTSYQWVMGDGMVITDKNVNTYRYAQKGKYEVKLVVFFKNQSDTLRFDVWVTDTALDKNNVYSSVAPQVWDPNTSSIRYLNCPGSQFEFHGATNTELIHHQWRLPNGTLLNARDTSWAFATPGDYPVVYRFENQCGAKDSITYVLNVRPNDSLVPPTVTLMMGTGPDGSICPGNRVSFSAYPAAGVYVKWLFHDGTTSNETYQVLKRYDTAGYYPVKLAVWNSCGVRDTLYCTISVSTSSSAYADFSILNNSSDGDAHCVGDSIYATADTLSHTTYLSQTTVQHLWQMGDGTSYTTANIAHKYAAPGWYTITHQTTNSCGQKAWEAHSLWVNTSTVPLANFYLPQECSCVHDSIMVDQFSQDADSIVIVMGDGGKITLNRDNYFPHLWYVYHTPGNYTVRLYAYNKCGVDSALDRIVVVPLPVADILQHDTTVQLGITLNFQANKAGAIKHLWRYGNGAGDTSSAINLQRTFNTKGSFTIYLMDWSDQGCDNLDSVRIQVVDQTGLNSLSASPMNLMVYPNPANEQLWIRYEGSSREQLKVALLDIRGRVCIQQDEQVLPGQAFTCSVAGLMPGLYFVRVQAGDWQGIVRFVKM